MNEMNQLHSGYVGVVSEVIFAVRDVMSNPEDLLEKMPSKGSVSMVMDIFIFFIIHFCLKEKS
ncbi:MAG TPA: hypothetical protein DCW42_04985 [Bacteroidetes bacterium]|nr:hypothetical protein [Bacteroidota bacterium]